MIPAGKSFESSISGCQGVLRETSIRVSQSGAVPDIPSLFSLEYLEQRILFDLSLSLYPKI